VPRPLTLLAAGLIGLGLLGCGSEGPERSSEPRVISLTPSISRIVQVLGADDLLIGVDEFSRRLPGLEGVPSVGGLFSPDLERIVDLDPTLILAVRTEQQRATLDRLRSRGVYVQEIEPYALDEVLESFVTVGKLVRREAAAREIAQKVRLELGVIRESVSGRRTVTTALVVQRDPLYVAGSGGFVSELIDIAGGENVFADLPSPYPRVSLEVLAARAPEVILDTAAEPERGEAGVREARAFWSRFAWAKRVEVIPRGVLTLPSPDLPKAAWMLRTRLHPDPTPGP
jgi:iron complex transport system substrate-binding protein